jgi:hypothetical protein
MPPEIASRPETTKQIIGLARLAVLCTLALAGVLLLADLLGRGWSSASLRFLSEQVVITLVYGIAAWRFGNRKPALDDTARRGASFGSRSLVSTGGRGRSIPIARAGTWCMGRISIKTLYSRFTLAQLSPITATTVKHDITGT